MLRSKVWPVLIDDKDVRINRLDRQEAAKAPSSSPANDKIEPGDVLRAELALLQPVKIPFPMVVHQEIDLDAFSLTGSEGPKLLRKLRRSFVTNHQESRAPADNLVGKCHACGAKNLDLLLGSFGVVLGETEDRDLGNTLTLAHFVESKTRFNPRLIA